MTSLFLPACSPAMAAEVWLAILIVVELLVSTCCDIVIVLVSTALTDRSAGAIVWSLLTKAGRLEEVPSCLLDVKFPPATCVSSTGCELAVSLIVWLPLMLLPLFFFFLPLINLNNFELVHLACRAGVLSASWWVASFALLAQLNLN